MVKISFIWFWDHCHFWNLLFSNQLLIICGLADGISLETTNQVQIYKLLKSLLIGFKQCHCLKLFQRTSRHMPRSQSGGRFCTDCLTSCGLWTTSSWSCYGDWLSWQPRLCWDLWPRLTRQASWRRRRYCLLISVFSCYFTYSCVLHLKLLNDS